MSNRPWPKVPTRVPNGEAVRRKAVTLKLPVPLLEALKQRAKEASAEAGYKVSQSTVVSVALLEDDRLQHLYQEKQTHQPGS